MVVVVMGLPGSGKSWFAQRFAEMIGAEYISSDKVRKKMFSWRTYSDKEKNAVYEEMLSETQQAVQQQKDAVLDATFYKEDIRKKFVANAGVGSDVFFIEIVADERLVFERLKKKRTDSEAGVEVYKKIKEQWEPMRELHLILQSKEHNIDKMLQKAAAYLPLKNDK